MKYKELLELYRNGQLEQSQREQVEADIDRHDAITEYLCEESAFPLLEESAFANGQENVDEDNNLTLEIQKTIRRILLKLGIIIGISVLTVTLCIIFVLPQAVNLFYYQPDRPVSEISDRIAVPTNQMSLDFSVWSELFLPGRYRNNVVSESKGYGAYDIGIVQNISPDGKFYTVNGQLVRNQLKLYDPNYFALPVSNAFMLPEGKDSQYVSLYVDEKTGEEIPYSREEIRRESFQYLNEKPTNDLLIAYISLDQIMDYDSFVQWYQGLEFRHSDAWAGIYAEDEYGQWATENTGLSLTPSGFCIEWDHERYPHLSLLGELDNMKADIEDELLFQEHFLSMLKYLQDHPNLAALFGYGALRQNLEAAQAYVQENGLHVYGLAVVASRDELLKLESEENISQIRTVPY